MPDLLLYDFHLSGNCHKIRVFAAILGLPLELKNVQVLDGETRTEDFYQISPMQQIPVLKDGDIIVQDSQAILLYMAMKYGHDWIDRTPEGMAAIHEWLSYGAKEASNGPQMSRLSFLDPHENIDLERAQAVGHKVLAQLDRILSTRDWLCLGKPTIADLAVFPYVALSREGNLPLDDHPNVLAWIDRIRAIPGYYPMEGMLPAL
ncbi:glutathione S-transferase family protein [Paracoccus saliphilus]|uniref:Glutathione S-transferase n=1 Tax=Paracoccus saliphilus TaxID=405559 RepID=A0AA45W2Q2_9RHOB|nr:glutathione S-transferase N-terminal domain-containing protein [Paracoccus saliphilus]WCR01444.1 glutathione S-transferase N-terminal domain-containing protein [Paracoccus saliphilus]SIS69362.1 glutathione S-transferase [Paracoccus saliphilus]